MKFRIFALTLGSVLVLGFAQNSTTGGCGSAVGDGGEVLQIHICERIEVIGYAPPYFVYPPVRPPDYIDDGGGNGGTSGGGGPTFPGYCQAVRDAIASDSDFMNKQLNRAKGIALDALSDNPECMILIGAGYNASQILRDHRFDVYGPNRSLIEPTAIGELNPCFDPSEDGLKARVTEFGLGGTIQLFPEFFVMDPGVQASSLLHEVGHLTNGPRHSSIDCDVIMGYQNAIQNACQLPVWRDPSCY